MQQSRIWAYLLPLMLGVSVVGCSVQTESAPAPLATVSAAPYAGATAAATPAIEIPEAGCDACELPEVIPLPEGYNLEDDLSARAEESDSKAGIELGEYHAISVQEAKAMMDSGDAVTIVDVRTRDEYESGHIPGALLIPNETISDQPPEFLPDQAATILVYCRSGNRSRQASQKLADMGYTAVYDFGGIIDWPYETVAGTNP